MAAHVGLEVAVKISNKGGKGDETNRCCGVTAKGQTAFAGEVAPEVYDARSGVLQETLNGVVPLSPGCFRWIVVERCFPLVRQGDPVKRGDEREKEIGLRCCEGVIGG